MRYDQETVLEIFAKIMSKFCSQRCVCMQAQS